MNAKIENLPTTAVYFGGVYCHIVRSETGQSDESRAVANLAHNVFTHFRSPILASEIIKDPAQRFYSLKSQWQRDTSFSSDTNEICTHEAYQKIIGMGEKALPFIYDELKTNPDYWFWALKAITDEDPVPESDRGNLEVMTSLWLDYLDEHFISAGRSTGFDELPKNRLVNF